MLEKINNSTNKLDNTQAYIDKVVQGELYEYLLGVIKEYDLCFATNRDETKLSILKGYFSDNRFFGQPDKDAAMKQLFYMLFPEVYDLFKIIKKGEKNKLAILLQRIESYLVIEVICKRIAKHNKEIPLYTIHDSIATTEEYLDIVHDIMMESLKEYIGYYPFLKDEPWY